MRVWVWTKVFLSFPFRHLLLLLLCWHPRAWGTPELPVLGETYQIGQFIPTLWGLTNVRYLKSLSYKRRFKRNDFRGWNFRLTDAGKRGNFFSKEVPHGGPLSPEGWQWVRWWRNLPAAQGGPFFLRANVRSCILFSPESIMIMWQRKSAGGLLLTSQLRMLFWATCSFIQNWVFIIIKSSGCML